MSEVKEDKVVILWQLSMMRMKMNYFGFQDIYLERNKQKKEPKRLLLLYL
jgi:hypothetical protein